ncbi:cytochrome c oxidase subunit 7C, mitochondrial-like [Stomoxys calcitrans]|uniref:cytochrome c oxidase subunit 7C, mitochondrial-like n=1 Tax=Stomoxys calcitrans TaxID=35570 RepID=UPI0027E334FC|nr:cytochrome c oxidase subunit 7C, mitochondrial-like [Stomoxys calcitrans]
MLGIAKQLVNSYPNSLANRAIIVRNYKGGVPGCNLPFKLDNPYRFTVFYLVAGIIGFGAPWLVVMHQMLRPYNYE